MDNARAIAIIAVVLGHTMSQIINMKNDPSGLLGERIIVMFDMPLFTILAGYCGLPSLSKITDFKELCIYIFKQWKRIMLPSGFINALFYCCCGHLTESPLKLVVRFLYPGIFWYSVMLFALFCHIGFATFIASKYKRCKTVVLTIFFFLALPIRFMWIGEMIPYFVLGMIMRNFNIFDKMTIKTNLLILLPLLCVGAAFAYESNYYVMTNFYERDFLDFLLNNEILIWIARFMICSGLCFTILYLCKAYNKVVINLTNMGRITLPIYILSSVFFVTCGHPSVHSQIVNTSVYVWAMSCYSHRVLAVCLLSVFIIAISESIIMVADKNKWSRMLLLGK